MITERERQITELKEEWLTVIAWILAILTVGIPLTLIFFIIKWVVG